MPVTAHFIGDSHTTGYGLTDVATRYSTVLCAAKGWTENNLGQISVTSGDNAIVESALTTLAIAPTDVSFWLAGYNDQSTFGSNAATLANTREIVRSVMARLAVPTASVKKYNDPSVVYAGTWATFPAALGGFAFSSASGSTVSLTLTGTAIVLGFVRGGGGGNVSITVDGGTPQTYSCLFTGDFSHVDHNDASPGALVITGLTPGPHAVVISRSSGTVFFNYGFGVSGPPGPRACVGGVLSMHPDAYNSPLGTYQSVELYTQMIDDVVLDLQAAGLAVTHAVTRVDVARQMQSDKIHVLPVGHQRIARQMYGGMFPAFDAVAPAPADVRFGSPAYGPAGNDLVGTLTKPAGVGTVAATADFTVTTAQALLTDKFVQPRDADRIAIGPPIYGSLIPVQKPTGTEYYLFSGFVPVGSRTAELVSTSAGSIGVAALEFGQVVVTSNLGPGASPNTIFIPQAGGTTPVADADVWITTDSAGTNTIAGTLQTNSQGKVVFLLDAGLTYYLWAQKDGENSIVGQAFVAE